MNLTSAHVWLVRRLTRRESRLGRVISPLLIGIWSLVSCVSLLLLARYSHVAGDANQPPPVWPARSALARSPQKATLLVFVHPHCPCSRATIGELARLLSRSEGRAEAVVVFWKPEEFQPGWEKSDLWHSAAAIPGVRVRCDEGGTECQIFRARTSGLTLLYDRQGELQFHGGITASRGHEGDNVGRSAIVSLLLDRYTLVTHTSVFGCKLQGAISQRGVE